MKIFLVEMVSWAFPPAAFHEGFHLATSYPEENSGPRFPQFEQIDLYTTLLYQPQGFPQQFIDLIDINVHGNVVRHFHLPA